MPTSQDTNHSPQLFAIPQETTNYYTGCTDFSIPSLLIEIQEEKEMLETEDREPGRCDFLTDILAILEHTKNITMHDLRELTPDEIYAITSDVVRLKNSQHIDGQIKRIYQEARPAIQKVLLAALI